MIKYINKQKKDEIFNYLQLSRNIYIYKKITNEIELINNFIKFIRTPKNGLSRISFDTIGNSSSYIEDLDILIGKNNLYASIRGESSNLEFLLFVKEYFSRY